MGWVGPAAAVDSPYPCDAHVAFLRALISLLYVMAYEKTDESQLNLIKLVVRQLFISKNEEACVPRPISVSSSPAIPGENCVHSRTMTGFNSYESAV